MKVQLGGGTNIASAVEYGRQLIEQPAKSVIILVSDFYEGGSSSLLTHQVKKCVFNTITTGETNTATGIKTHIAHR
ncbi:VWA domain-containing protein [Bacillus sp. HC-Mk]